LLLLTKLEKIRTQTKNDDRLAFSLEAICHAASCDLLSEHLYRALNENHATCGSGRQCSLAAELSSARGCVVCAIDDYDRMEKGRFSRPLSALG
jgi:hypothetical protein